MYRDEKQQLKVTFQKLLEQNNDIDSFMANTEMIKRKIQKGLIYSSISEGDFDRIRHSVIQELRTVNESILDPVQKQRAEFVFNKNDKMLPKVKKWILEKIEDWRNGLSVNFQVVISDIEMYGSSTGYQYTDVSDIDMHARTNLTAEQIKEIGKLINLGMLLDNDKNPVTLFLLTKDEVIDLDDLENLYSISDDKWLKKSSKNEFEVPYAYILKLAEFFMNAFDLSISQYERAKQQYLTYLRLDPNREEITEKEKNEAVSGALTDLKVAHDRVRMGKKVMMSFAKEGYEEETEFLIHITYNKNKDPRESVNNSVYKMIEKFGYKDKLHDVIKDGEDLINKELNGHTKLNEYISSKENLSIGGIEQKIVLEFKGNITVIGEDKKDKPILFESFYTDEGLYIGPYDDMTVYVKDWGLTQLQSSNPTSKVVSVGFSEKEQKWYGWSHRARSKFGIGDETKEGQISPFPIGYVIKSLEEAKEAAKYFSEGVS